MQVILSYLQDYFKQVDKSILLFCAAFAAIIITLNFRFHIETKWLYNLPSGLSRFAGFYCVYAISFIIPCIVVALRCHSDALQLPAFWVTLLLAPALFAFKVTFSGLTQLIAGDGRVPLLRYYAIISNLPSRLVLLTLPLFLFWWQQQSTSSFWGLTSHNFNWHPYALMLLIMVPLIAFASTQADFLHMYPKLKQVAFMEKDYPRSWWYKILYELSYGLDFFSIEIFFRGFLVFAFVRYLGADAVLPMAVFYCSIHFGKPLFECISSFFGGLLLGIIAYKTRSILGGIVVHLGIAWMMELGGYIGNLYKK